MSTPPRPLPGSFAHLRPSATWSHERGTIWFYEPTPDSLYTIAVGHADAEQARSLRARGDQVLLRNERAWAIHDWGELTSYEAAARPHITDWAVERRDRIAACIVLTGSKLVAMGVSAARIPLTFAGVSLEAFVDRAAFEERALEALTGRQRRTP